MVEVIIYCTRTCGFCRMAIMLLEKKGARINKIQLDDHPDKHQEMTEKTGQTSVPQVFINGEHVGGYMELTELDMDGELDTKLGLKEIN